MPTWSEQWDVGGEGFFFFRNKRTSQWWAGGAMEFFALLRGWNNGESEK